MSRVLIVGGAGFIGSHFVDHYLSEGNAEAVRVFDNFSSGRVWHLERHHHDDRFDVVRGEASDLDSITKAMIGFDTVVHLASNPDIARAATEPDIDFREGTALTSNVVEGARRAGVRTVLYASGSGVYGDLGPLEVGEDHGPLVPVSTYGASKLAGEGLVCAYAHMFGMRGLAFRFGNVVGPRQTHGVGLDFTRALMRQSSSLRILGDGNQSKSYIHVSDVVAAVTHAAQTSSATYDCYNVATGDSLTVREIALIAIECMGLDAGSVELEFTGGSRGWKGDVPVVRLDTRKIRGTGWVNRFLSRHAMKAAIESMIDDLRDGRI